MTLFFSFNMSGDELRDGKLTLRALFADEAVRVELSWACSLWCKHSSVFPWSRDRGKRGRTCALVSLHQAPFLPLLLHALQPSGAERKRAGERQLVSKYLFHSNSFIFGNATPRLQAAQMVDDAKTLSWACYQLEENHRMLAHQGDSNFSTATPGQTDTSSSPPSCLRQWPAPDAPEEGTEHPPRT